jgi:hypothetical protein
MARAQRLWMAATSARRYLDRHPIKVCLRPQRVRHQGVRATPGYGARWRNRRPLFALGHAIRRDEPARLTL